MRWRGFLGLLVCIAGALVVVTAVVPRAARTLSLLRARGFVWLRSVTPPGAGAILFAPDPNALDRLHRAIGAVSSPNPRPAAPAQPPPDQQTEAARNRLRDSARGPEGAALLTAADQQTQAALNQLRSELQSKRGLESAALTAAHSRELAELRRRQHGNAAAALAVPSLIAGRVLFEPERAMQLHRAEVILVRMDAGASPDLQAGIDPTRYKIDSVKVGRRMRVHLAGNPPDAFDIVPMSPPDEQQAVTNLSASSWMWSVTPKKDGAAALLLNIWALAKVDGSDTLVPLFEKTEIIHVHGVPLPEVNAASLWEKMLEKMAEHAGEALWAAFGAAVSAFGGWIANWWRKKPKSAAAPAGS